MRQNIRNYIWSTNYIYFIDYILFFYVENKATYDNKRHNISNSRNIEYIDKVIVEDKIKKVTNKYILDWYNLEDIRHKIPVIINF